MCRKFRPRTTDSSDRIPPAPDLVQRSFSAAGPDRLWLCDITYIPTGEGFCYLATVMDAWSRRIVGWTVQYACNAYGGLLVAHGIRQSMSHARDCYDDAMAESLFSTLKRELTLHETYATRAQARVAVFQWIAMYYHRARLHSALGYLSPEQLRRSTARQGDTSYRVSILMR